MIESIDFGFFLDRLPEQGSICCKSSRGAEDVIVCNSWRRWLVEVLPLVVKSMKVVFQIVLAIGGGGQDW